jgi:hypothetical protein
MRFVTALVVLLTASTAAGAQTIPEVEKHALVDIFQATNGPGWERHDGWLTTEDPCNWLGVMCNWSPSPGSPTLTVVALNLPFNNLKGALPSALLDLPNLKTLDLRGNGLSGEVPETWLERWDNNQFELSLSGNKFSNFVQRVRITFSAPALLCAFDEDVRYTVEISENGGAHFESIRCASRNRDSREAYCLVKDGRAPSLDRLGRAFKRIAFEKLASEYSYPFTFTTHQAYVTTTVWYGDGHSQQLETYGGQSPIEAYIVEQLVWGLVNQVTWQHQLKKKM